MYNLYGKKFKFTFSKKKFHTKVNGQNIFDDFLQLIHALDDGVHAVFVELGVLDVVGPRWAARVAQVRSMARLRLAVDEQMQRLQASLRT